MVEMVNVVDMVEGNFQLQMKESFTISCDYLIKCNPNGPKCLYINQAQNAIIDDRALVMRDVTSLLQSGLRLL